MKISVEISMYPLAQEYKPLIKAFIERLKQQNGIVAETNGMSTQVFGEYEDVFSALKNEIFEEFQKGDKVVFVMKCINAHLQITK